MNIREAHDQFLRECQDGTLPRRSPGTIANYRCVFGLLTKWFVLTDVSEFDENVARMFLRRGEERSEWKAASIVSYRKNLSAFVQWCIAKGYLEVDPFRGIPWPQIPTRLPEYYSEEEIDRLLYIVATKSAGDLNAKRDLAIVATQLLTGLRRGELIGLKVTDVDFNQDCIRVRAETTKNRTPRVVMMPHRLRQILEDYWKAREMHNAETQWFWISTTHKNHRFTKDGLKHLVDRLSKQAGFRVKLHKFRHTFATQFYAGSHDIAGLQQVLGHKDLNTTMIYAHTLPKHTAASMEKNPLNQMI